MIIEANSEAATKQLGEKIATLLKGGEVIELIGDIGAGKTTFTKGLAAGLGVEDDVQSPSFTISRVYAIANGLQLAHYDFYRLNDPGVMTHEIAEAVNDSGMITIVEWANAIEHVLPADRLQVYITSPSVETRRIQLQPLGERYTALVKALA